MIPEDLPCEQHSTGRARVERCDGTEVGLVLPGRCNDLHNFQISRMPLICGKPSQPSNVALLDPGQFGAIERHRSIT